MNSTELNYQTSFVINQFIANNKAFTALDITNALRALFPNERIKYEDVRNNINDFPITTTSYMVSIITVTTSDGKNVKAKLYHSANDVFDLDSTYDNNARMLKPLHTMTVSVVSDIDIVNAVDDNSSEFDPEEYWETISQSYSF